MIMGPRYLVTITYGADSKEQWSFAGTGAEKRAFSLLNSCTRRKTGFESVVVSRLSHNGSWEDLAATTRN